MKMPESIVGEIVRGFGFYLELARELLLLVCKQFVSIQSVFLVSAEDWELWNLPAAETCGVN